MRLLGLDSSVTGKWGSFANKFNKLPRSIKVKKSKVRPRTGHEGSEEE